MTDDRWEEELSKLVDYHIAGIKHSRENVDPTTAREAVELLDIADLLWEEAHGAPPLEQDPVAAILGLVPDSAHSLDGAALKQAMKGAGLKTSDLAEKLSNRGWEVANRDVFNWQTRSDAIVPPALIQAIAEITGTAADKLTVDRGDSPTHQAFKSVTASPAFKSLAERWARLRGTTLSLGASALESQLATSVFRGSHPSEEQMLASLEALVEALESRSDEDR
ncbi:hypothetical protein [Nocardioides coralli]|uniref:hypothetical protein n=1 Tax=Nocardioides coralli TaxID=2872154 RepID=UPI001CA3CD08|nr:hypothetical protein [Nocardioides coralli]QZY27786.1 hypothetical protein K6T13_09705 [Nocardioides coralli]